MASMEPAQELIEVVTALRNANEALLDATMSGDGARRLGCSKMSRYWSGAGTAWCTKATRCSPGHIVV